MEKETQYNYIFVRKDIAIEFQIVQACHASCVAGERFGGSDSHMVLFGLSGPDELEELALRLQMHKIPFVTFYEPDNNMGNSAVGTAPLFGEVRGRMKKIIDELELKMWSN